MSLIPGVRVGKDILKKDAAALGGDVTTKGAQDLWRRKYQEISQVMAKYIATLISFKAKLEGKESWDIQSENKIVQLDLILDSELHIIIWVIMVKPIQDMKIFQLKAGS